MADMNWETRCQDLEQQLRDMKEERDMFASQMVEMEQELVEANTDARTAQAALKQAREFGRFNTDRGVAIAQHFERLYLRCVRAEMEKELLEAITDVRSGKVALKQAQNEAQVLWTRLANAESRLQAAETHTGQLVKQLEAIQGQSHGLIADLQGTDHDAPQTNRTPSTLEAKHAQCIARPRSLDIAPANENQENRSSQKRELEYPQSAKKLQGTRSADPHHWLLEDGQQENIQTPTKEQLETNLKWQELRNIKAGETKWFKVPDSLALSQAARQAQQALEAAEEQYLASAEKPRSKKYREPWAPPAIGSLKFKPDN